MKGEGRNLFVVDSGNLLFRKPPTSAARKREALLKADILVRAYEKMGYTAVNLGEKDLMMGFGFVNEIVKEEEFPLISANLVDRKTRKTVFRPFIIKEISGINIGVIGLMSYWFNEVLKEREPYLEILDPLNAVKPYVVQLRQACDLVIVLSQLGERGDRELALKVRGIDIIIGGGVSKKTGYSRMKETIICRVELRGGYLGKLELFLTRNVKPLHFIDYEERERVVKKLENIEKRRMDIEREIGLNTGESPSKREVRMKEAEILERRIREVQQRIADFDQKNLYKNEVIPIKVTIEDDLVIGKMIENYRIELTKLYGIERTVGKVPEKPLSEAQMLASIPGESAYRGALSCKNCHIRNFNAWSATAHAKATRTISEAFKKRPPLEDCLICHTTGYGDIQEYRFVEDVPPYLHGVQCEACHGVAKGHPGFGTRFRKVTMGICRNCHTKDQSPAFHYRNYLLRIGCTIQR